MKKKLDMFIQFKEVDYSRKKKREEKGIIWT